MNISINNGYYGFNQATMFKSRKLPYSKEEINNILEPFIDSGLCIEKIKQITGLSRRTLESWFRERIGQLPKERKLEAENKRLREELIIHKNSGKDYSTIAKIYGKTKKWVEHKMFELKLTNSFNDIKEVLDANIPWMIEAGYTVNKMSSALGISKKAIFNWISKNKQQSIVKLRHDANVEIWHESKNKTYDLREKLTAFFEKGGTIQEAKKEFNMNPPSLYYWMNMYNIKSNKQKAHIYMEENIQRMLAEKMSIKDMAKEIGLSEITVIRYINSLKEC